MNTKIKILKSVENPTLLVLVILGILLNLACKKKKSEEMQPMLAPNSQSESLPWGYIKSINIDSSTEYYEYDSLHRISTVTSNGVTWKFTYNGNILLYSPNNNLSYEKYTLNEMGFVSIPPGNVGKFDYDSLGNCVAYLVNSFQLYYTWKDGNRIQKVTYDPCPDTDCYSDTVDYFYHLDSISSYKGTKNMIYGNHSKNVISRTEYRNSIGKKSLTDFTYEWDEKGRVVRERQIQDGTELKIISYRHR